MTFYRNLCTRICMMTNERFKMLPDAKYYFLIKSLVGSDVVPIVSRPRNTFPYPLWPKIDLSSQITHQSWHQIKHYIMLIIVIYYSVFYLQTHVYLKSKSQIYIKIEDHRANWSLKRHYLFDVLVVRVAVLHRLRQFSIGFGLPDSSEAVQYLTCLRWWWLFGLLPYIGFGSFP